MRNRLQKTRVNSEKSVRRLRWKGGCGGWYVLKVESGKAQPR